MGCKSVSVRSSNPPIVKGLAVAAVAFAVGAEATLRTGGEGAPVLATDRGTARVGGGVAVGELLAAVEELLAAVGEVCATGAFTAGTRSLLPQGQATILPAAESGMLSRVPQEGHFTFIVTRRHGWSGRKRSSPHRMLDGVPPMRPSLHRDDADFGSRKRKLVCNARLGIPIMRSSRRAQPCGRRGKFRLAPNQSGDKSSRTANNTALPCWCSPPWV